MCNSLQTMGLLEKAKQPKEKWRDVTMECVAALSKTGGMAYIELYYMGHKVAYQYGDDKGARWAESSDKSHNIRFTTNPDDASEFRVEERVA